MRRSTAEKLPGGGGGRGEEIRALNMKIATVEDRLQVS